MGGKNVTVKLGRHQALVLFEWLSSLDSLGAAAFHHPSEEKVLWKIEGQLESVLEEPFAPNYNEILDKARKQVDAET